MPQLALCEKGGFRVWKKPTQHAGSYSVRIGLLLAALLVAWVPVSHAQAFLPTMSEHQLQVGIGGIPDLGVQANYVLVRNFYTREITFYGNVAPRFLGNKRNSVQISGGLGGLVRTFAILRTIGNVDTRGWDLDVGVRFGPGLFFVQDETRADKNQRFRPFFEPVIRGTSTMRGGRIFFIEIGTHRPVIRTGLWFPLTPRNPQ